MLAVHEVQEQTLAKTRLLLVGEDPAVEALIQHLFTNDYRLIFVDTAAEALSTLRRQRADLVLIDTTAPLLDSSDLLIALRADWSNAELPVILIAAPRNHTAAVRGLQLGANDYITKPLDADEVKARISTQIALKQATSERQQIDRQLKFSQDMQENFSRIISHDLKGPLTNIRMAQYMLRDILHDNREADIYLDNMDIALNGMVEMIRMFLDALDTQQLEAKLEPLYTHELIVEISEQYQLVAERKGVLLTTIPSAHEVMADPRMLRQVVGNLISNALKFSPKGTETRVWAEPRGGYIRICVADGGPGIPDSERDKLFQMFSKLSNRPTGGETSTGLGLWIVHELMHQQNGRVGVDNLDGGGAQFWVELPSAYTGR